MSPISLELAQYIQRHVSDLPEEFGAWPARKSRKEPNAFSLHGNQIYLWARRSDGVVLCLDHKSASLKI